MRPSLAELERVCQKPDHRRIGNWPVRRIYRPLALRVTWLIAPWGCTADAATAIAWVSGLAAAALLGCGTPATWLIAAILWHWSYLWDHVDGQLARLRGTDSLAGTQLDYLMHHTLHLFLPIGMGHGASAATSERIWLLLGIIWGGALLLVGLVHDARYKAIIRRLKRVRGQLLLVGGGGGRPEAQPPVPRRPLRLLAWTIRKVCEPHVVMNLLTVVVVIQLLGRDASLLGGRVLLGVLAPLTVVVAGLQILRGHTRRDADCEFEAWFRPPAGERLVFRDGWWVVEPVATSSDTPSHPE